MCPWALRFRDFGRGVPLVAASPLTSGWGEVVTPFATPLGRAGAASALGTSTCGMEMAGRPTPFGTACCGTGTGVGAGEPWLTIGEAVSDWD